MMFLLVRFTIWIALALVSAGCLGDVGPHDLLDVTVELSSDVLTVPNSVNVRVIATNRGTNTMWVTAYACPAAFVVMDAEHRKVGPESQPCLMIGLPPRELARGERFVYEYVWHGSGSAAVLASGTYSIVGEVLSSAGFIRGQQVSLRLIRDEEGTR